MAESKHARTVSRITRRIPWWHQANEWLSGQPEEVITMILWVLIILGIGVALWAPPLVKAAVVTYWILP